MIYYIGKEDDILKRLLKKEFQRKYNWEVNYDQNNIFLRPRKENITFQIYRQCITITTPEKKIIKNNIYYNKIITNIYKYYIQYIITKFISHRPTKIYSLFLLSFFQLNTLDTKFYLY